MDKLEFYKLLDKYLEGKASEEELTILENYYNSFQQSGQWNEAELGSSQELGSRMLQQLNETIEKPVKATVLPLYKRSSFRMTAAAVLLVLGTSIWWMINKKTELAVAKTDMIKSESQTVISDHVVLTLANGKHIFLDTASNGVVAHIDNNAVRKKGSLIVFEHKKAASDPLILSAAFHSISVPKGGHYQVLLPDGSMVWLNAASTLRFPAAFNTKERKVELIGEAYFEVVKDAGKPFRVHISTLGNRQKGALVEVLGTHFNINAYDDEEVFKTTLLEGRVKVTSLQAPVAMEQDSRILSPGQQALIATNQTQAEGIEVDTVDAEAVVAWKYNMFNFNTADLQTIMRQIARWYDVEVVYEGTIPVKNFSGKINRNTELTTVLKILEQSGIRFHLEGKKIMISS